jgi:hypothetical protein
VNGISLHVWASVAVIVAVGALWLSGFGAGRMRPDGPEQTEAEAYEDGYQDGYQEGVHDGRAEVPAMRAESVAGPDEDGYAGLPESPPAVPAAEHAAVGRAVREDGQGVEGGTWLDVMHEQLAPEHISETGPQRAIVLELGPPEPAVTEGEARFAAEWEQVRWRLEMDADVARVDRELAVTA